MKLETIRPEKVKEKVCWLIGWFRDAVGPEIITKQMRWLVGWPEKCSKSQNEKNLSVTGPSRPKFRPPDGDL